MTTSMIVEICRTPQAAESVRRDRSAKYPAWWILVDEGAHDGMPAWIVRAIPGRPKE